MISFEFKALHANGKIVEDRLQAEGRQEAIRQIESRGWTLLKIVEGSLDSKKITQEISLPWKSKGVSFEALEEFTRSLSSLLAGHVPLSRALKILYEETSLPAVKKEWKELHDRVIDGVPLATAMDRSPHVFSKIYTAMVESGEAGGFLELVLSQIADFQSREKELRSKVFAALMYPLILLLLAVSVTIYLLVFFIPRFQTLFAGFDAALPWLTQMVVHLSDLCRAYGLYIGLALAALFPVIKHWISQDRYRRMWEDILFQIPLIGSLASRLASARFCRMLGTLLSAGVPLVEGLMVARKSLGYQMLIDLVGTSVEGVKKGESLSNSLKSCRLLFPGSMLEMISVSEESGRLDQELVRLAGVSEGILDRQLKTTVALAEPIMLFVIALFIGVIFIAMVIPIFSIQDYIK